MTITRHFNLTVSDPSWQPCLKDALKKMEPRYLEKLYHDSNWLPGHEKIFSAFSLPVNQVKYILFGESPYPRKASANGYAFWDAAVTELWSPSGLSKTVNRATSLRNMIKMLLVADNLLSPDQTTQSNIAQLDKKNLIQTNNHFFKNLLTHGFLLLNASLVLQSTPVQKDAQAWQPFIQHIIKYLVEKNPRVELILFGQIARYIDQLDLPVTIPKIYWTFVLTFFISISLIYIKKAAIFALV